MLKSRYDNSGLGQRPRGAGVARGLGRASRVALASLSLGLLWGCGPTRAPADVAYAAALAPPPPQTPGPDYRITIGDELHIRFRYQPEQDEQLPVRPDGRISIGAAGEVDAVGLTPAELSRVIEERSSQHLRDPEVTVVVTKVGPQQVYVGGEVDKPGVVPLQPGMTPLQAVMQTGGFLNTAKRDSVVLITPSADGKFSASKVNMEQVLEDGVPERVRLRANEVIYVPKTLIGDMNEVVELYIRGLIPTLPRVGAGYSLHH